MAAPAPVTMAPVSDSDASGQVAGRLFRLSTGVFFVGGFLSSLISLFVPRMTLVYQLSYTQGLLIQLAFHASYLLFAIPIARAIMTMGYMRSAATGLAIMAIACILFLGAAGLHSYRLVLASLLILAAGITFLQIAGNTVVTLVGDSRAAAFRLNLLQGFNSLGTVVAPLAGAEYVLGGGPQAAGLAAVTAIAPPFVFAIGLLVFLAIAFAVSRDLLRFSAHGTTSRARLDWAALLADRRLLAGAAAIFVYVGAEVTIGTLLTNYLVLPHVLDAEPVTAARLVSLYWGGAMVGRILGAFVMRRVRPALVLVSAAIGATLLTGVAAGAEGAAGAVALIAVGLCNSIMYPTIYALALPRDPALATPGSMLLCIAVVGGAVVPMLTGVLADAAGLAVSLGLPALCYLLIAAFARSQLGKGTARAWS